MLIRLVRWNDALRFLWNLALEQRLMGLARPAGQKRYPSAFDQIKELTELRANLPWLADVPRNVCAQLLVDLDQAWQRYFKRLIRAPRWRRKDAGTVSFCEPHPKNWEIVGTTLRFPKLGSLPIVAHRPLEGKPKTCRLKRDGDQWFAIIVCEVERPDPAPRTEPVVAIDRGVVNAVADSDGRLVESPRFYERSLKRLARAQRAVSRKKKGSKNREKAKNRVMRLHRKLRRQREHFLHVLSHGYAKSHGVVVLEKLETTNMVRAGRGLARGIIDSGWGAFATQLRYKLAWSGGTLIEVPAAYSSQTCAACGAVDAKSRRSQSVFRCTSCGHEAHADLNAALILKSRYIESRANRSGKPADGNLPEGSERSRKRVALRVPRRDPESLSR